MKVLIIVCFSLIVVFLCPCQGSTTVKIDGAVDKKGNHEIEANETLRSALRKAAIGDFAVITSIFVTRKGQDEVVHYRINLKSLLKKSLDFRLENGDEIFVPERGAEFPPFANKSVIVD